MKLIPRRFLHHFSLVKPQTFFLQRRKLGFEIFNILLVFIFVEFIAVKHKKRRIAFTSVMRQMRNRERENVKKEKQVSFFYYCY